MKNDNLSAEKFVPNYNPVYGPELWYAIHATELARNLIICNVLEHLFPSRPLHSIRYLHSGMLVSIFAFDGIIYREQ